MPRPLRVFLCHASQDKPPVRRLHDALKAEDWIDPWLDKAKILPGQDWRIIIEKAVEYADVVIVCLSNQSVSKEGFVQREIKYAYDLALEKPEETIFLIPLRLDDCPVPRGLRTFQWVDYFGSDNSDAYSDLLEALKLRYKQKSDLEAGELARKVVAEKADWEVIREKTHREQAEREAQEKVEREAAEKVALKKAEYETAEKAKREAVEKAVREKEQREQVQQEAARKAVHEKAQRETAQKAEQKKPAGRSFPIALSGFGLLFLIVICIGGIFLVYKLLSPPATPAPTEAPMATVAPTQVPMVTEPPVATDVPTETPPPGIGTTMIGADGMTLLYVPAGEFTMGSDQGDQDEKPVHKVTVDAFWIDQTEVTNKMYSLCVAADVCKQPAHASSATHSRYYGNSEFDNYPVIHVDWSMAKAYCEWAGRDLPTEAQWEKAARGPDGNMYPWGNTFNGKFVNFCDTNCSYDWANKTYNDDYAEVSPVGSYPSGQSVYGALDMAGNVWEWVDDWYDVYPNGTTTSSKFGQKYHVLRGGSWFVSMHDVRSSERYFVDLTDSFNYFSGFRCALSQ
jgi:formylglycine-generating enzyme required for sulfatase activity